MRKTKVDVGKTPYIRAQRKLRQAAKSGFVIPIAQDEAQAVLKRLNERKIDLITRRDAVREFAEELGGKMEFWSPSHDAVRCVKQFVDALKEAAAGTPHVNYEVEWLCDYQDYITFMDNQTEVLFEMMRDRGGKDE